MAAPSTIPGSPHTRPPRERMVRAAARLFRVHGVTATGLRDIVETADAPRGSLQHYFPGGKEQLIREALEYAGDRAGHHVVRLLDGLEQRTPGNLFAAMVGEWRDLYLRAGYAEGCPLAAAATDTVTGSPGVRAALGEALWRWQRPLEAALADLGVPDDRRSSLAVLMMSALEGALILARSREDTSVIDTVIAELRPMLDDAAR
jgi:AcrR family transcriptional regulator